MPTPETEQEHGIRIIVLGCAGTGKTTFTRYAGQKLGLSQIILDDIWPPKLTPGDLPLFRKLVADLHQGENWISDGNFSQATFDIRLPRATMIVWLTEPRLKCCFRAIQRVLRKGESHKITKLRDVLKFIWWFDEVNKPIIETQIGLHHPSIRIVKTSSKNAFAALEKALAETQDTFDQWDD